MDAGRVCRSLTWFAERARAYRPLRRVVWRQSSVSCVARARDLLRGRLRRKTIEHIHTNASKPFNRVISNVLIVCVYSICFVLCCFCWWFIVRTQANNTYCTLLGLIPAVPLLRGLSGQYSDWRFRIWPNTHTHSMLRINFLPYLSACPGLYPGLCCCCCCCCTVKMRIMRARVRLYL